MSHESEDALRQIREKADEAAKLEKVYERLHERAKESKAAWEAAENELRELCRSWDTSEEVATRPMIKAIEQAAESNGEPAEANTLTPEQISAASEKGLSPSEYSEDISSKPSRRRKAKAAAEE